MAFILVLKPRAKKELTNLEDIDRIKVRVVLEAILKNPFLGKKLSGELPNQYSIRAWPFRVIYEIRKKELVILILRIRHRKDVYK
ncbi:type II toxin-antitoxin system RelE/ParE family toxin [Candidatus Nomurabacteria bacterium]|nr:type II toxin-antitoxin system RelE/ParE family toxin [Candidatus Nomurabacteria bacterium]